MTDREIRESLVTQSINAAIRAGAAIMEIYDRNEECQVELKSDHTPLIAADRAAHIAIKEALGTTRIPILSEEGREMEYGERKNWEMFWLVDPLDGTIEFINRSGEFTVNIALIYKGSAICSVIYAPSLGRLNFAMRDMGSYLLTDIATSATSSLSYDHISQGATKLPRTNTPPPQQRVAITRSRQNERTHLLIEELRSEVRNFEVLEQGSSYKFCMLAEGSVDLYIRTSSAYEWDIAAGQLILTEAGGHIEVIDSDEEILYNKESLHTPYFKAHGSTSLFK